MQEQVTKFVEQYTGTFVKSPHGISGQCVSVPSEFAVQQGWPELFGPGDGTALEIWDNGISGYEKVANVSGPNGNMPVCGDFIFFGSEYGGGAGHTALVISATLEEVTTFEQNDPDGSTAHQKTYNYNDLQGWFHHPDNTPEPSTVLVKALREVNVRTAPNTSAEVTSVLQTGQTFEAYPQTVVGESVSGNDQWWHSVPGHYVWSGDCERA